jgi:hypothetical protein
MNSQGKWYLWKNQAASQREFWSPEGRWTTNAKEAAFFDSLQEANNEAHHRASKSTTYYVVADQATLDVFA